MLERWAARGRILADATRPRVMGIVNVTPDSFSDGGLAFDADAAIARALVLVEAGAEILDVGGESSRPGAVVVPVEEEIRRVVPVIAGIAARTSVAISVDTTKPEVARRAIEAGALIVNDIEGMRNPSMIEVVATTGAAVVLMHMRGTPRTMQADPRYEDVVAEVHAELENRIRACEAAGIARDRIAIDPGIGFGKTFEHNRTLLRNLERFASLGCAVLVGISRKGFLKTITGRGLNERATASVAASLASIARGASVVRVHDVAAMVDAVKVWTSLMGEDGSSWTPPPTTLG